MTTDIRAALEGLVSAIDPEDLDKGPLATAYRDARAALAAEAEGEELRLDGGYESGSMWTGHPLRPAALATEPEPPADGEVAELVAWLRCQKGQIPGSYNEFDRRIDRAADLLSRLAPQSAPLAEPPSDEELVNTYWKVWDEYLDRPNSVQHVASLRAVLARWGTSTLAQVRSSLGDGPQPVPEGPSDEELLELMPQQFRDDLATVSRLAAHGTSSDVTPGIFRVSLNTGALDYARAALARWGQAPNA